MTRQRNMNLGELVRKAQEDLAKDDSQFAPVLRRWLDGQPCEHPGCLSPVTHPCEGCGRTGGITPHPMAHTEEDIHRITAAALNRVPPADVTPEMRARARTINFATNYGTPMNHFPISGTITGRIPSEPANAIEHSRPLPQTNPALTHIFSVMDFSGVERKVLAYLSWPDCPNCKQSATGVYAHKHACTRCGWPNPKRSALT